MEHILSGGKPIVLKREVGKNEQLCGFERHTVYTV
jgi:hypothetical protein